MNADARAFRTLLFIPLIVSFILFAGPQIAFISQSFHENLGLGKLSDAYSLVNYKRFFSSEIYLGASSLTAGLALLTSSISLLVALPVAYTLARSSPTRRSILLGLLVAASFITPIVKDLGFIVLLGRQGFVNHILIAIGLHPVQWIGSISAVAIGMVHYTIPLAALLLYPVMQTVPKNLEDAARAHGCTPWQVATRVLIPIIWPALINTLLTLFNLAIGAFTTPAILGGGRVMTIPVLIQRAVTLEVDFAMAATMATVMLFFVLLINIVVGYVLLRPQSQTRGRAALATGAVKEAGA